jgi:hypothetical protein
LLLGGLLVLMEVLNQNFVFLPNLLTCLRAFCLYDPNPG